MLGRGPSGPRADPPPRVWHAGPVHVVIMGCGRVGSSLAETLDHLGHTVAVIDQDAASFRRLSKDYRGRTVQGVGFDREVLLEAGIEQAAAFAAVSSGDNSNILAARVAREMFGIENVAARIYDQRRAAVYQRLGIPTVATVRWTTDQMLRRLLPQGAQPEWLDASGSVRLAEVHLDPGWIGQRLTRVESVTPAHVAFVTRLGEGVLPKPDMLLQEGDLLHVLVPEGQLDEVQSVLDRPPAKGQDD